MAYAEEPPPPSIRALIRLRVPRSVEPRELFRLDLLQRLARAYRIEFDHTYAPVPIRPPRAAQQEFLEKNLQLVVVRARVDPRDLASLQAEPAVDRVSRDAPLQPFERRHAVAAAERGGRVECASAEQPTGTVRQVVRDLGVDHIWSGGHTGRGIVVGVVDGGITAYSRPTQFGGWPAIPEAPALGEVIGGWPAADWGTTAEGWGQHGNMIAFDVQAMAPEADIWDIRIWEPDVTFPALVSNAVAAYRAVIDHHRVHGVPHVLVNAWGLYDADNGPEYAFDPESDMALELEHALDEGILVLFAAGNCGDGCPFPGDTPCGLGSRGPAGSILGPNGHPQVMSVGAATIHGEWCGYTSQGPATLPPNDPDKPDFCSISQFAGFFPNDSGLRPYDGGTSAATGIAGGIVALLKQARPDLTQEECKWLLTSTARPIRTPAAHFGAGAGLINPLQAYRTL
jgi:subtilisin family serine protease